LIIKQLHKHVTAFLFPGVLSACFIYQVLPWVPIPWTSSKWDYQYQTGKCA